MPSLTQAAADSASNLAQVQAGFSQPGAMSRDDIVYLLVLISAIIVLCGAAALYNHRRKRRQKKGWSSITNSEAIWEILTKALSRQAHFVMEIYQADRTINFKGVLSGLEEDSYLILDLSETPSASAEFNDLPGMIHLNYRPAPKEPNEHYQFATKIISSRFVRNKGWREAQLIIPVPKVLTSAQRRSYLRLEPTEAFSFDCRLSNVPEGSFPTIEDLDEICQGRVLDISIGGAQLKLSASLPLRETQRFLGIINLPTQNLDVDIQNPTLILLVQLLNQEYVKENPEYGQEAHTILRVRFLGRYAKDGTKNLWVYNGLTQTSLEDLSHWMHAYQRYQIKRKRNLLPSDDKNLRPPNMFPSLPPKRPPLRKDKTLDP
jgi:hypothetical protein